MYCKISTMMYQLGWSKLVTESNFSKLIKMARVTKTIIRQCKAKDLSMVLLRREKRRADKLSGKICQVEK